MNIPQQTQYTLQPFHCRRSLPSGYTVYCTKITINIVYTLHRMICLYYHVFIIKWLSMAKIAALIARLVPTTASPLSISFGWLPHCQQTTLSHTCPSYGVMWLHNQREAVSKITSTNHSCIQWNATILNLLNVDTLFKRQFAKVQSASL